MNKKKIYKLKKDVYKANIKLIQSGLVVSTFGNVSEIDREYGIVAIKLSGVDYRKIRPGKTRQRCLLWTEVNKNYYYKKEIK